MICAKCRQDRDTCHFKPVRRNKRGYKSICKKCEPIFTGIYKITSPLGRVYIGQASDIEERINKYKKLQNCKNQPKLYNSFITEGVENHIFEIIEECLEEDLNCRERYWQDEFDVLNGGLNCKLTECGAKRGVFDEGTRSKMGSKGEKNFFYGKKGSDSMWYGVKGENHHNFGRPSPTKDLKLLHIQGENSPNWGKSRSAETKQKISENRIKNKVAAGCNNPKAKSVINTDTKEYFFCVKEACKSIGISTTTFNRYMNGKLKNKSPLIYLSNYTEDV